MTINSKTGSFIPRDCDVGKINLEDQLTGPNLNESLGDKYNIGIKGRIEF